MKSSRPKLPTGPTAILSALMEEQSGLIDLLEAPERIAHAGRNFWTGTLHGQPVVLVVSGIGKVAAATTACALIEKFNVARIAFTGVAGGLAAGVNVGDIVIASHFVQHDMDASPLFARYEVPLYGQTLFAADESLTKLLADAAQTVLDHGHVNSVFTQARVLQGLMASGDRFVSGTVEARVLRESLASAGHAVLAVEMEGAAVAQVCFDYGVPFAAVRTISDRADDTAHVDFPSFVKDTASRYARAIIERFLNAIPTR